jgi:hypothetical protein
MAAALDARAGDNRRMEDLVENLTRGNVTEVKVVLASVVAALAVYQVVLMSVGTGSCGHSSSRPARRLQRTGRSAMRSSSSPSSSR